MRTLIHPPSLRSPAPFPCEATSSGEQGWEGAHSIELSRLIEIPSRAVVAMAFRPGARVEQRRSIGGLSPDPVPFVEARARKIRAVRDGRTAIVGLIPTDGVEHE